MHPGRGGLSGWHLPVGRGPSVSKASAVRQLPLLELPTPSRSPPPTSRPLARRLAGMPIPLNWLSSLRVPLFPLSPTRTHTCDP